MFRHKLSIPLMPNGIGIG
ncbi:unnamed protein product, partial [Rotaria sp. Silwood1]